MARTELFRFVKDTLLAARTADQMKVCDDEFLQISNRSQISRRTLLKTAGIGGLALATEAASEKAFAGLLPTVSSSRVAIIGAGTAGLTAAYSLLKHGIIADLYEAGARVGGRMHTHYGFNKQKMFCELGGELVDTGHTKLQALCRELGVGLQAFSAEKNPDSLWNELYYFGGRSLSASDVLEAFRPLAKSMAVDVQSFSEDGSVLIPTYQKPMGAKNFDEMNLRAYLDSKSSLVPAWVIDLIASAYRGEFGLEIEEQSALNLLTLIGMDTQEFKLFGESDEVMRIQGGSSALPNALTLRIAGKARFEMLHRLVKIEERSSGIRLVFKTGSRTVEKTYARVLIAVPFSVLRHVEGIRSLRLSEPKMNCINSLGYGTNAKLILGFKERFWKKSMGNSAASAGNIYTDLGSQQFWDTSRLQPGESGVLTNFMGGRRGAELSGHSISEALSDLNAMYPGSAAMHDNSVAAKVWSRDPLALGSYSCPMPGQFTSIIGSAGEAELSGRLIFAGEHCSLESMGYMNGAVETGLRAADEIIAQAGVRSQIRF